MRQMRLMMTDGYENLKEEAQQREEWQSQSFEPGLEVDNRKMKYLCYLCHHHHTPKAHRCPCKLPPCFHNPRWLWLLFYYLFMYMFIFNMHVRIENGQMIRKLCFLPRYKISKYVSVLMISIGIATATIASAGDVVTVPPCFYNSCCCNCSSLLL